MRHGEIPPGALANILERATTEAYENRKRVELSVEVAREVVKYLRRLDLWENELRARAKAKELPKE